MSTITKEQLRERAREKVKSLEFSITQTAFADSRAELEEELELARIALASLEAEAVAWRSLYYESHGLLTGSKNVLASWKKQGWKCEPLYAAPPAPAKSEPVAWLWSHRKHPSEVTLVRPEDDERAEGAHWSGWSCQALYAAPPAPVSVPDGYRLQPISEYDAMCAAMLQGAENAGSPTTMKTAPALDSSPKIAESPSGINQGKSEPVTTAYKSPDDFICMLTGRAKYLREKGEIKSPELLERAAAALQDEIVNTPPIPNGWKLVPIDPTKDMLRAGQSVVGFWLNTVHCYSKMLAAAPEAPQQEVK